MGRMGNSSSTGARVCNFSDPIQSLLKQRGLKISVSTVQTIVKDIDRTAPWFAVSGDLTLPCWEKLGRDLEKAKQEDRLSKGTLLLWRLVHSCLKEGTHMDLVRQGRKTLSEHQDSLSEAESREEERKRPKDKKKRKDDKKPPREGEERKLADKQEGLYPLLDEFANLEISDEDRNSEELSEVDEEELEEAAAHYEEERYGRQRVGGTAGRSAKPMAPSAPPFVTAPPPYCPPTGGCHFISGKTWSRLATAFPVFQDPQTGNRYHEPVAYKQLKDVVESAKAYGVNASYTLTLISRIATQALTPSDWMEIARACLSTGQYLDFKSLVIDAAHVQARINAQNNHPHWTAEMLLGQGQWTANQTAFPVEVYGQINDIYLKAWKALPNRGEVSGNLTKIIQGPNEPFSDFVARMMEAAGRIFGDMEAAMPLVQQLVFEQATKECRRAITPWKGKNIEAWIKACRELGGPLTNAGLAAAVVAATRRARKTGVGTCFSCGRPGHIKRHCPQARSSDNNSQALQRQPGTCPRCKRGKHWANECRSTKDINGQPIPNYSQQPPQPSKNGQRGPRPQGPKAFGAMQEPNMRPPLPPGEQHQAPQGWTSVPPPDWY